MQPLTGVTLLEETYHFRQDLRAYNLTTSPVLFLCFVFVIKDTMSQLLTHTTAVLHLPS